VSADGVFKGILSFRGVITDLNLNIQDVFADLNCTITLSKETKEVQGSIVNPDGTPFYRFTRALQPSVHSPFDDGVTTVE
jgi:hypothetical protein